MSTNKADLTRPQLNLLVIRSTDIHRAVSFYQRLGIEFRLHAHGNGPEHYASLNSDFVFEIYPATPANAGGASVRLGFLIQGMDALVEALREASVTIVSEPRDSEWGRRAVLRDFDRNTVELLEAAVDVQSEACTVWVFNGTKGSFPSGVFTSRELAEAWIASEELEGTLTEYPLDIPAYDYAIKMKWFTPKHDGQGDSQFIQRFTSASQNHFHYENGKPISAPGNDI